MSRQTWSLDFEHWTLIFRSGVAIVLTGVYVRYVEGNEDYRKDAMDFVQAERLELHRFDLSKESVSHLP